MGALDCGENESVEGEAAVGGLDWIRGRGDSEDGEEEPAADGSCAFRMVSACNLLNSPFSSSSGGRGPWKPPPPPPSRSSRKKLASGAVNPGYSGLGLRPRQVSVDGPPSCCGVGEGPEGGCKLVVVLMMLRVQRRMFLDSKGEKKVSRPLHHAFPPPPPTHWQYIHRSPNPPDIWIL